MKVRYSRRSLSLYRFIAIEQLRFGREDSLRVLISSEQVYFLGRSDPTHDNIVLQVAYSELYHCRSIPYRKSTSHDTLLSIVLAISYNYFGGRYLCLEITTLKLTANAWYFHVLFSQWDFIKFIKFVFKVTKKRDVRLLSHVLIELCLSTHRLGYTKSTYFN